MNLKIVVLIVTLWASFSGCATVFKGYYDTVEIINAPYDLKIRTKDGAEIPIITVQEKEYVVNEYGVYSNQTKIVVGRAIRIRSGVDHVLVLNYQGKEVTYEAYKKLNMGWFVLGMLTGVGGAIDYITGNWNYFDPIRFNQ